MTSEFVCRTSDETYKVGERVGRGLSAGDVLLLYGGLGAGKTLLTKGILHALGYDIDEVTSPSFTLVNLYKTAEFDVYHIDLWRLENSSDASEAVGLDELSERGDSIVIIEWADRLREQACPRNAVSIRIEGDGDEPRKIRIEGRLSSSVLADST